MPLSKSSDEPSPSASDTTAAGLFEAEPLPFDLDDPPFFFGQWLATDDARIRNEPKPMRSAYRTSRSWIARRGAIPR